MQEFFDIFGTPIHFSKITSFRVVQREYIYRPTYREVIIPGRLFQSERIAYQFVSMQPYAAIIAGGGSRDSSLSKYNPIGFAQAAGKDFLDGAITAVGEKLRFKGFRSQKYRCVNQTGREFTIYLEDVPALLARSDGKISDVHKNDEMYELLGEPIAPAINIIPALLIKTKEEDFIFYGNGIQLKDIGKEYERLKYEISMYQEQKKIAAKAGKRIALPKFQFELPKGKRKEIVVKEDTIEEGQSKIIEKEQDDDAE